MRAAAHKPFCVIIHIACPARSTSGDSPPQQVWLWGARLMLGIYIYIYVKDTSSQRVVHMKSITPLMQDASAATVQRDAWVSCLDGGGTPLLKAVSAFGSCGRKKSNIERDLLRFARRERLMANVELFWVRIPMRNKRCPTRFFFQKHPVLLPHELFAELFRRGRFPASMFGAGGASEVADWWAAVASEDWASHHPVPPSERAACIPIGFFGDDAPFNHDSLTVLNWSSVLAGRSSWTARHVFTVLPKRWALKSSLRALQHVLCWSFTCLRKGAFPDVDHTGAAWAVEDWRCRVAGQRLAGEWTASLVELRGDWTWQRDVYMVPDWKGKHVCHRCPAGRVFPWLFSDVRDRPSWRLRPLTHENFMRVVERFPLASLPEFHSSMITIDMITLCIWVSAQSATGTFWPLWWRRVSTVPSKTTRSPRNT